MRRVLWQYFGGFQALRPTSEKASRVASLPYDVVSSERAMHWEKLPGFFFACRKGEIDCLKETDMYDECVYRKAEENLQKMIRGNTHRRRKKMFLHLRADQKRKVSDRLCWLQFY